MATTRASTASSGTQAKRWAKARLKGGTVRLLNGEIFYTLREAQVLIEDWRREYNEFRPHSSLGQQPPAPEAWLHSGQIAAAV